MTILRRTFAAVALLSVAILHAASCGAASQYIFAGIPWGSNADTVKAKMKEAGFDFVASEKGGQTFEGSVLGHKAVIFTRIEDAKLVKLRVMLETPDREARKTYKTMKEELTKYGVPTRTLESFAPPYRDGDGHETQAIRTGRATFIAQWLADAQQRGAKDTLTLEIADDLDIHVSYESAEWQAIADRHRQRSTRPF